MTTEPAPPRVGTTAPDLDLAQFGGGRWRLHDHRGRVVVLIFHRHIH